MRRTVALITLSSCLLIATTSVVTVAGPLLAGAATAEETAATDGGAHVRNRARQAFNAGLEAAAATLGMSTDALRGELLAGRTAGQIADEAGVSRSDLADAIVAGLEARLDAAVGAGRLTRAEADARKVAIEAKVTERLDRVGGPGRGQRDHGGDRRPGDGTGPRGGARPTRA